MNHFKKGFLSLTLAKGGMGAGNKLYIKNTGALGRKLCIKQYSDAEGENCCSTYSTDVPSRCEANIAMLEKTVLVIISNGKQEVMRAAIQSGKLRAAKKPKPPEEAATTGFTAPEFRTDQAHPVHSPRLAGVLS